MSKQNHEYFNLALDQLAHELHISRERYRDIICGAAMPDNTFYEMRGRLKIIDELLDTVLHNIDQKLQGIDNGQ